MSYEVEEKHMWFEIWTKQKIFSWTNNRILVSRSETFFKMGENCFFKIDFLGYLSNIFLSSSSHITMNILGGKAQRFDGKTQPLLAFSWLRYYSHFIRIIPMIYREKILKNPVDRLSLYWRSPGYATTYRHTPQWHISTELCSSLLWSTEVFSSSEKFEGNLFNRSKHFCNVNQSKWSFEAIWEGVNRFLVYSSRRERQWKCWLFPIDQMNTKKRNFCADDYQEHSSQSFQCPNSSN